MKIFVIHRFEDNKKARELIKELSRNAKINLQPVFLDSYRNGSWKAKAIDEIYNSEIVVVYNLQHCKESPNALWELNKAEEAKKEIIELSEKNNDEAISRLITVYNMKDEFEDCFSSNTDNTMELYKLMVQSSEQLIQRRQATNAFFITVIGSLLAVAGLFASTGTLNGDSIFILYGFAGVGILLCNSWKNLIENYGKLNKAKFDVILRLEKALGAQIYSAEWIALGKGMRKEKYKSFTATEKNVPFLFMLLIIVLTIAITIWIIYKNDLF
ncbi:RipA family octameric membrane protein [Cohnella thailandensis]|uniref:TIR domain-containing protein n=1 Tax=Cohnella thailandensis TaxID=557557 RepID=A0A841T3U7_9BACL|nr:hypothetical protein [Cohnella thailandensis]MBB6638292.1 hypothetical protein [Cohnella thailandensis]MBP1977229.1 hypothetical protein [Cohnella thailandensis]